MGRKRRDFGRKWREDDLIMIEFGLDASTLKRQETKYKRKDLRITPELPVEPVDKFELLRERGRAWKARS